MSLREKGFEIFPFDQGISNWARGAYPVASNLAKDPKLQQEWLRHGSTWFAGVNVFPNNTSGTWENGPVLTGNAVDAAKNLCPFEIEWDTAQISIPYQGYPKQDLSESDANHRFRKNRDAAHLDGLLPVGSNRRRYMQEFHAFILGIPLNSAPAEAAPLVVWEGSQKIIQNWLAERLSPVDPSEWNKIELTECYSEIRKDIFDRCKRTCVTVPVGSAYLVHKFALHGVAPWQHDIEGPKEGRMVAYFRPHWQGNLDQWLGL